MKVSPEIKSLLTPYGYRKSGSSFWKTENGFYRLLHFQGGAYGDYFFVNIGLHPVGLPLLYTGRLYMPKRPKESECALRQRLDQLTDKTAAFRGDSVGFPQGAEAQLLPAILPDIERWMDTWGSYDAILAASFEELSPLFSAVPLVWEKAFYLLKTYCAQMAGDRITAGEYFCIYRQKSPDIDVAPVDQYLYHLINDS